MKKRIVKRVAVALLIICLLAGVGIAATWPHWWWPVRSAHVWIDGKQANDVQVFHGADGRYLLYRGDRLMNVRLHGRLIHWRMDPAIVPGRRQPVDEASIFKPFEYHWSDHGGFIAFPFGVYSRDIPFDSSPMYAYTDLKYVPHLVRQKNGFTFSIHMISDSIGPGWDRAVPCRVEIP